MFRTFLLSLSVSMAWVCQGQELFPFEVAGLYGYMDSAGHVVIPLRYLEAEKFDDGYAQVAISTSDYKTTWTWIDKQGNFMDPEYSKIKGPLNIDIFIYHDGLKTQEQNGRYGVVDRRGEWVVAPKYLSVGNFSNGWAYFRDSTAEEGHYTGYVSAGGREMPLHFLSAGDFSENLAAVKTAEGYGVINTRGEWVIEPSFEYIRKFSEGLAAAKKDADGKIGFIDSTGTWVIPPRYETLFPMFSDGVAIVKTRRGREVIDRHGQTILSAQELENKGLGLDGFSEGLIVCDDKTIPRPEIDLATTLENLNKGITEPGDTVGTYGYLNKSGNWHIPPKFRYAYPFAHGLAKVVFTDRNWGYINRNGEIIYRQGGIPAHFMPYDHMPKIEYKELFNEQGRWFSANSETQQAQVIAGEYRLQNSGPYLPSPLPLNLEGFQLIAEITWKSGVDNKPYGIGFRIDETTKVEVALAANGYYKIDAWVNDEHRPVLNWTSSDMVRRNGKNRLNLKRKGTGLILSINGHSGIVADLPEPENALTTVKPYLFSWGEQTVAFDNLALSSWDPKIDPAGWELPEGAHESWTLMDYYLLRSVFCALEELQASNSCECISDELTKMLTTQEFRDKTWEESVLKEAINKCIRSHNETQPTAKTQPATPPKPLPGGDNRYKLEAKLKEEEYPQTWKQDQKTQQYVLEGAYFLYAQIVPLPPLPEADPKRTQVLQVQVNAPQWDWHYPSLLSNTNEDRAMSFTLTGNYCFTFDRDPTLYNDPSVKLIGEKIDLEMPGERETLTLKLVRKPNNEFAFYRNGELVVTRSFSPGEASPRFFIASARADNVRFSDIRYWQE